MRRRKEKISSLTEGHRNLLAIPTGPDIPEDLQPGDVFFIVNPEQDLGWWYGVQPDGSFVAMESIKRFDAEDGWIDVC